MSSNPIFKFEEAVRKQCKASILIEGLPGKGKSGLALELAYYLSGNVWEDIYAVDTENKSLPLYRDLPTSNGLTFGPFKVGPLTADVGYKPSNYIAFRDLAVKSGAKTVIFDSVSHSWMYKGGVLDLVAEAKASGNKLYAKDSYAAWSDPTVMKEKQDLLELLRHNDVHQICTVRVKEKMAYDTDAVTGKTVLNSLGDQQIMQADIKYEPDLVLKMISPGSKRKQPVAEVTKSRYAIFEEGQQYTFTAPLILQLKQYLEEGVDPATLLEEQKKEYIIAISDILKTKPGFIPIWEKIKETEGYTTETKLKDMSLEKIKRLFLKLTTD